jgi:hypothetical protein
MVISAFGRDICYHIVRMVKSTKALGKQGSSMRRAGISDQKFSKHETITEISRDRFRSWIQRGIGTSVIYKF